MTALGPGQYAIGAEVKSVGDDGPGSWTAVASAPTLDRDGEIIVEGAFQPLPAKVPVHDQHFGNLIGSARPYYKGPELLIDGVFASTTLAQTMRTLVKEGHLSTMSVVFMDAQKERGDDGITRITQGELLAVDFAPIASNRDARVLASRAYHPKAPNLGDYARAKAALVEAELALMDTAVTPRTERWAKGVLAEAEAYLRTVKENNR